MKLVHEVKREVGFRDEATQVRHIRLWTAVVEKNKFSFGGLILLKMAILDSW